MWLAAVLLGLSACTTPDPTPLAAARPVMPAPDPSMVMAGVWPFVLEQGVHGAPCRIDLLESEGDIGVVSLDEGGRIRSIVETTLGGQTPRQMDFEYDGQGRLSAVGNAPRSEWMRYTYDADGRLAERRYSDGECRFTQTFSYEGRKAKLLDDTGCDGTIDSDALSIEQDDRGLWRLAGDDPKKAQLVYNEKGFPLGVAVAGEPIYVYERDDSGRITAITPLRSTWLEADGATLVYDCK